MKLNAVCPISDRRVDENVTRLNAVLTVLLLTVFVWTNHVFPLLILAIDFLARGAKRPEYSLFAQLSIRTTLWLGITPKMINGGPKFFAARIGFLFSVAILLAYVAGAVWLQYALTAVFAFCALLEAAFAFCVACQIYPYFLSLNNLFAKTRD